MIPPDRRAAWAGLLTVALAASSALAAPPAPAPFELKDGDRVVLLGGTFIERDQSYGYLETLLTSRFPGRDVTFRNLGWSGDTVWGEARARFGKAPEGFAHLKEHVEDLKPTVLFVNYGQNESFAGKDGLAGFEEGLNTLLNILDKTGARIVLITPRRLEHLAPPLPDPARANERMADYVAVLRSAATSRGYRLVDLFDGWKPDPKAPLTDNGVHLTERGYAAAAGAIVEALGLETKPAVVGIRRGAVSKANAGCRVEAIEATPRGPSFRVTLAQLPPPGPALAPGDGGRVTVAGLAEGAYNLAIDGKVVAAGSGGPGEVDFPLDSGPDRDQVERLRATINAKNELYFHRWRPQNETYLFGFRKHEQGNNAIEIPKFDPLVAAKEDEIAKLRVPATHTYEITRKEEAR